MDFGRLCIHAAVHLMPAVVGRCRYLQGPVDVSDTLALVESWLSGAQLVDDLYSFSSRSLR
jgi:hypothetical protein